MNKEASDRHPLCKVAADFIATCLPGAPPPGADPALVKHIEGCPACSREIAVRTRVAQGLKHAVSAEPEAPYLEARIRRSIREQGRRGRAPRWFWDWRTAAIAAVVVVSIATAAAYHFGHLRMTPGSQDAYVAGISAKVPPILSVGLRDHVHCSVFGKPPRRRPSASEMLTWLGPQYQGLLPLVQAKAPREYTVTTAHRCSFHGRIYVHVALEGESRQLSLVITRRRPGESYDTASLRPVLSASGIPVYGDGVQRFTIAGFEAAGYLVYLVSDLDQPQNLSIMAALAQPVRDLLAGVRG